ncbi:dimethylglycine dehydrogenase, mitochondrial-like [Liolophura sinensis]|uniref:dimethylglycine dehydrogenase, mitochondrial-like n=1 Tax=Liolophura sinensis TaxID=3198878 RepID=UPI0031584EC4
MHRLIFSLQPALRRTSHLLNRTPWTPGAQAYRCLSQSSNNDQHADVVIIGGGVIGTSTAYHLAKRGVPQVVLLEKSELTAGSTWHAAGLIAYFNPGINVKRVHYDSLQLYAKLPEETEQEIGLHVPGSIRLATTPERVDEFRYQMQRQGWHSAAQRIIGPDEIKQLHPLLNTENILAGLYNEGDGYVDPYSLTHALAIGARKHGAKLLTNTGVNSMNLREDGQWDIETTKGLIRAKQVLNAAGFWGREVAQLAGIDVPLVPVHHTYVVTSEIPEVVALTKETPVIRDLESSCYLRQERNGLLLGPYESQDKMKLRDDWYDQGVPPGFGKELFEEDLDALNDYLVQVMETIPVMKEASIKNAICGPITYSPDGLPIVGPHQGAANYWVALGFGYGIVHAGGIGKYLADWMVNGEPPYDLIELDHSRYGWWTDRSYTLAKARETYSMNNAVMYPKEERPAGRATRRQSGVYEVLQDQGAQFGFRTGWEQPNWFALPGDDPGYNPSFYRTNWFEPVRREVTMVREHVGVIDLTPAGKFRITGQDAQQLLNYVYSNVLPEVDDYKTCYILTNKGKVYAENLLARQGQDEFFCVTGPLSELHDLRILETIAREKNLDVQITNRSDTLGCLGLAGPMAADVLSHVANEQLAMRCFSFSVTDRPVLAVNVSLTGESGWELYTETDSMAALYKALMEAGKKHHIGNFGSYAYNTLRIESGIPAWGSDMKMDYNVLESRLESKIEDNKDCDFLGKSAIQELKKSPVSQSLVLLSMKTEDVDPEGNETIWSGEQVIGHTTSGCHGYTVGKSLAFAYVSCSHSSPESEVTVELLGKKYPAVVLPGSPLSSKSARS